MSSLKPVEKMVFEDILGMISGYVLEYNNNQFADLFNSCLGINIYDNKYSYNGDSKANHLRAFWETESDQNVGKILKSLLEVWDYLNPKPNEENKKRFLKAKQITNNLLGIQSKSSQDESNFLVKDFSYDDITKIGIDSKILPIIKDRLNEMQRCMEVNASLSAIFLCGSILEGILLSIANKNPKSFNTSKSAPKLKNGEVRKFHEWTLSQLIDVSYDCGFLEKHIEDLSHVIRKYRNYIHPYQQIQSNFHPTKVTADICILSLKLAITDLKVNNNE